MMQRLGSSKTAKPGSAGRHPSPDQEFQPIYPDHLKVIPYDASHAPQVAETTELSAVEGEQNDENPVRPLVVQGLDLYVSENALAHHTNEYEHTEDDRITGEIPLLTVRRGQPFNVKLTLNRPYRKDKDKIYLQLQIGEEPKVSRETEQRLPLRNRLEARKWSAAVKGQTENDLFLSMQASPRAVVGKWRLSIETSSVELDEDDQEPTVFRYTHTEGIYILFNPWCKEDQTFMPDEVWRDETVLNEAGKVFTGNHKQITSRPWNYGQFEDGILDCALQLLDKVNLSTFVRHDPLKIVRAITTAVTQTDDTGLIVADWSGNYPDGKTPNSWNGSVAILEQYWRENQPVKYGQCWVFAGVCTTLCRTLGIPSRCVTNYSSAHDGDGSVTMDAHWRYDGTPLEDYIEHSIWSFHVWNEAWVARPDLPSGYNGWQAFDATPQKTSEGTCQVGPCSVSAVKQGYVGFPRDGALVFAEVNADKVHWVLLEDASWRTIYDKYKVGRRISTKQPRNKKPDRAVSKIGLSARDPDRLDITNQYKFKEGSEQERTTFYRANLDCTRANNFTNENDDVKFDFETPDDILVGNNFEFRLKMQNHSRHRRTVTLDLFISTCHYTGISRKTLKRERFDVVIGPIKTQHSLMRITHEDYMPYLAEQAYFKIKAMATVEETGQIFTSEDDFRLIQPELNIQAPSKNRLGESMPLTIKLVNPTPVHLTGCHWHIEGAGIEKMKTLEQRDVEPYERTEVQLTLHPRRKGRRQIQASFTSNELSDVTGVITVDVEV